MLNEEQALRWKHTIWAWLDSGLSHHDIRVQAQGHLGTSTITEYIQMYNADWQDRTDDHAKARSGRPRKLTKADEKALEKHVTHGGHLRAFADRKGVSVATAAVAAKRIGLSPHKKRRKPFLTAKNIAARAAFCDKMLKLKYPWWRYVVWSDECPVPLSPSIADIYWSKDGAPPVNQFFEKNAGSLWIWAGISWFGVTPVLFLNHNEGGKFDSNRYIKEVLSKLPRLMTGKLASLALMEDGAPVHTAKVCQQFREEHGIKTFPGHEEKWPAKSPDLNPIENLWAHLKQRLHSLKKYPTTKESMKKAITKLWKTYDLKFVRNFLRDYPNRLKACMEAKGGATDY